jgi:catechol 2,3-dioxygenase-like lactoylglutathione lyase family enzyme
MLDHVGLVVTDYAKSKAFYEQALAPLGYAVLMEFGQTAGFGAGRPDFWVGAGEGGSQSGPIHLCFTATDSATVDAFHAAALAAGGQDNGAPGVRAIYHPTYYGAFVLDPDGNNVEAVHHGQPA